MNKQISERAKSSSTFFRPVRIGVLLMATLLIVFTTGCSAGGWTQEQVDEHINANLEYVDSIVDNNLERSREYFEEGHPYISGDFIDEHIGESREWLENHIERSRERLERIIGND